MSDWIELMKSDTEYADDLARRRQENAERKGYGPTRGSTLDRTKQLLNNSVGARCELAGFLFLRHYAPIGKFVWHQYTDDNPKGLPDLDDFIDVKGRRESWHDLPVQPDPKKLKDPRKGDRLDWAYLLIRAHRHPRYEIVGWCWGWEAHKLPLFDPRGGTDVAHWVKPTDRFFKPPSELCAELGRRHRFLAPASADYQWF